MYIASSETTACQEHDAKMWFAKRGTRSLQKAKSLCMECPERIKCLESVLVYEEDHDSIEWGVYGGLDPDERMSFHERPIVQVSA